MTPLPRILVVEDDRTLREGLREALRAQGFAVDVAPDGEAGARALDTLTFDLVVLDLMLPGRSGLELLRTLRLTDRDTPVIILTARGDESDKVLGLELGADDYVTKPFGLRELIARIRAHLRRRAPDTERPSPFTIGDARVDLAAFEIERGGETFGLSPREAAILQALRRAGGDAVPRHRLLDQVWGRGVHVTQRTIDTHVLNLRKKLERDPREPRWLLTVHGIGYRLLTGASTEP